MKDKKFTILDFKKKKIEKNKITMLTAYDCPMASFVDEAEIDAVLVGDSLGMVVLGYDSTVDVTMDEMIHHAKAVKKGVKNAFMIVDMPFLSYQVSDEDAVRNAGAFMKLTGCEAVKLEGGIEMVSRVKAIINAGIPVCGHVGLMPQMVSKLGGYRVQGKNETDKDKIIEDALSLEEAGCFAIILECVPEKLAEELTQKLSIPTIGIGAGKFCDGQVLVTHDMLGYGGAFVPKFVKQYTNLSKIIPEAMKKFKEETEKNIFPDKDTSY